MILFSAIFKFDLVTLKFYIRDFKVWVLVLCQPIKYK